MIQLNFLYHDTHVHLERLQSRQNTLHLVIVPSHRIRDPSDHPVRILGVPVQHAVHGVDEIACRRLVVLVQSNGVSKGGQLGLGVFDHGGDTFEQFDLHLVGLFRFIDPGRSRTDRRRGSSLEVGIGLVCIFLGSESVAEAGSTSVSFISRGLRELLVLDSVGSVSARLTSELTRRLHLDVSRSSTASLVSRGHGVGRCKAKVSPEGGRADKVDRELPGLVLVPRRHGLIVLPEGEVGSR